jgi:hypothetical protein
MISSRSSTTARKKSKFTVLGRDKLLGLKNFRPEKAIAKATPQSISKAKLQKDIPWMSVKNLRGKPSDNCYINLTAWKQIPYKESDFAYPKGYRRTENLKEIILSQKSRQALEDLVEGLSQ